MTDKSAVKRLVMRLLCGIAVPHKWTWKIGDTGGKLYLDAPPPDCARCERCGRKYGPDA